MTNETKIISFDLRSGIEHVEEHEIESLNAFLHVFVFVVEMTTRSQQRTQKTRKLPDV